MTLPGILITENRMAFIRFVFMQEGKAKFFIIAFRFKAMIIIHHQAALTPKSEVATPRPELVPQPF